MSEQQKQWRWLADAPDSRYESARRSLEFSAVLAALEACETERDTLKKQLEWYKCEAGYL